MIKLYYDIFVIVIIFSFFFSSFFFFFTEITQCRDKYLFRFEFISFDRMKKKKKLKLNILLYINVFFFFFFSFEKEQNDVNLFDLLDALPILFIRRSWIFKLWEKKFNSYVNYWASSKSLWKRSKRKFHKGYLALPIIQFADVKTSRERFMTRDVRFMLFESYDLSSYSLLL